MTDSGQAGEPRDPLLRSVAEHWDDILAIASETQRDRLRALVSGEAEPDPTEARAALADELLDILPHDHPVIRVLRAGVMYQSGVAERSMIELTESFLRLSLLVLPGSQPAWHVNGQNGHSEAQAAAGSPPGTAPADDFDRRVRARLLSLPAVAESEVGSAGATGSHLIRLPRPGLASQLPAFQFAATGTPWPIVQEVNELLDAERDPWGVTCWWVDPHARLDAAPAQLLGTGRDNLIRRAAMAVGEEF